MDFEMPYAQKHAWNNLKEAVNDYAEVTGSEIAVVTSYHKSTLHTGAGDSSQSAEKSLAFHGHGNLLLQLRQCLEQIKNGLETSGSQGERRRAALAFIPVPVKAEENYHNQAMARSLTSSFQSLKLDNRCPLQPMAQPASSSGAMLYIPHSGRRNKNRRRNESMNGEKQDILEMDENLLFEEQTTASRRSALSGSEDEDFDSADDFSHDTLRYQKPQRNFGYCTQRSTDGSKYGTSLPVNINMSFVRKHDGGARLHNLVRPHTQVQAQRNEVTPRADRPREPHHGYEDTPNVETMMASMQALARSVTDDSALIFGERPRPRLNTGESRGFKDLAK